VCVLLVLTGCSTYHASPPQAFVPPPRPAVLADIPLDVSLFDARVKPDYGDELKQAIRGTLQQTYPAARMRWLSDAAYGAPPAPDRVTVQITIAVYEAVFGTRIIGAVGLGMTSHASVVALGAPLAEGRWNGVTVLLTQYHDTRNGQARTQEQSI